MSETNVVTFDVTQDDWILYEWALGLALDEDWVDADRLDAARLAHAKAQVIARGVTKRGEGSGRPAVRF